MQKKKKVLVIVAHPDDETIWMGGTIYENTIEKDNWNLTVISLCRKDDEERSEKFKKVCEYFKAKCFMSDLEDEKLNPAPVSEIVNRILKFTEKNYDCIFTHGENGEYGHIRHKEANKAVREMLGSKLLSCNKVFFFAYLKRESKGTETGFDSYANKSANKFINLSSIELLKKKDLIQNIYGFQKGSFEERSCRKFESFNVKIVD